MLEYLKKYSVVKPLLEKTALDSRKWSLDLLIHPEKATILSFLNAHGVNTAVRNAAFAQFLLASDYLLRDGIGVKMALDCFDLGQADNLNGTDLTPRILTRYPQKTVAVFGASEEAQSACCRKLEGEGHKVVAGLHGFHSEDVYLATVMEKQPEILILCMGMPRQELLAAKLTEQGFRGIIICAGGWADFYSGHKPRAPLWMRKICMEWVFRLLKEPLRLGKRYSIDLLYFFYGLYCAYIYEIFNKRS